MRDILGLSGAVAVVAGVGPGLGAATAQMLARADAEVVLVARRPEILEQFSSAFAAEGLQTHTVAADLTSTEDRQRVVASVAERRGRIDVLVYNASSAGVNVAVADADLDDWRSLMDINLWSGIALTQLALPLLRAAERARVVFVSAMTTRMVSATGRGGYAMSKAALNQAVRTMAYELGSEHIRVNAVLPGWMETAAVTQWREDPAMRKYVHQAIGQIPLGHIPSPDEVAGSVLFLASRLSESVTGLLLDSNGGQYMNP
jgi:NAD(P)-dependent dehydrogenase (short-subunit alcohol dehydrogenase family)